MEAIRTDNQTVVVRSIIAWEDNFVTRFNKEEDRNEKIPILILYFQGGNKFQYYFSKGKDGSQYADYEAREKFKEKLLDAVENRDDV